MKFKLVLEEFETYYKTHVTEKPLSVIKNPTSEELEELIDEIGEPSLRSNYIRALVSNKDVYCWHGLALNHRMMAPKLQLEHSDCLPVYLELNDAGKVKKILVSERLTSALLPFVDKGKTGYIFKNSAFLTSLKKNANLNRILSDDVIIDSSRIEHFQEQVEELLGSKR